MKQREWTGHLPNCDFCSVEHKKNEVFYDAKTTFGMRWAFMCPKCWKKHGGGVLGMGKGQMYKLHHNGKWIKEAG